MFSSLQLSLGRHSFFDLTCWVSSGLNIFVTDRPCFTVFRMKIEQNLCIIVKFSAILYWRFMQIRQIIFNCTDMQIKYFILHKIVKLVMYYTPFYHPSLQNYLISKTVRFLAHPIQLELRMRMSAAVTSSFTADVSHNPTEHHKTWTPDSNKMLSWRGEAARCFVSLNISLNDSRSLKGIRNNISRKACMYSYKPPISTPL